MRTSLRVAALMGFLLNSALWFFSGPNFGWTKTSTIVTRIEPITGLEERVWEKRFLPGVDCLAAGALAGALLYAGSFAFGRQARRPRPTSPDR